MAVEHVVRDTESMTHDVQKALAGFDIYDNEGVGAALDAGCNSCNDHYAHIGQAKYPKYKLTPPWVHRKIQNISGVGQGASSIGKRRCSAAFVIQYLQISIMDTLGFAEMKCCDHLMFANLSGLETLRIQIDMRECAWETTMTNECCCPK